MGSGGSEVKAAMRGSGIRIARGLAAREENARGSPISADPWSSGKSRRAMTGLSLQLRPGQRAAFKRLWAKAHAQADQYAGGRGRGDGGKPATSPRSDGINGSRSGDKIQGEAGGSSREESCSGGNSAGSTEAALGNFLTKSASEPKSHKRVTTCKHGERGLRPRPLDSRQERGAALWFLNRWFDQPLPICTGLIAFMSSGINCSTTFPSSASLVDSPETRSLMR